jgi:diguanylate cyclase (GGDEF)-like protein
VTLDRTVDLGRTLSWWPLSVVLSHYRRRGVQKILALWMASTLLSVMLALAEARFNWSGLPFRFGSWTVGFSFYPPVTIGVLLTLWIGPAFGAITVYLSTLASGLYGGLSVSRAALFALGTPAELLLLWFLVLILRVEPRLSRLRDWGLFAPAALIAATASSVDIMLYNATHQVLLEQGQRLWLGWITGDVFQMLVLVAPLLWLAGPRPQKFVYRAISVPSRRDISTSRIFLLVTFVWATLGLLVFLGVRLLGRALEIPDFAVTMSGDPLLPRLREMGLFIGAFVLVLLITTMALTVALAGSGAHHREQSFRDELTGCLNRRAFRRLFLREAQRSASLNRSLSVVFFDVDRFKLFNDRYGHARGDVVLADIAREATAILSAQELLFRWGGEEFLVLLSHTGADAALQFAERLRARIEQTVGVVDGEKKEPVTISLGVSTADPPGFDEASLVRRADAALYQAKASGRNRVVTDLMMRASLPG